MRGLFCTPSSHQTHSSANLLQACIPHITLSTSFCPVCGSGTVRSAMTIEVSALRVSLRLRPVARTFGLSISGVLRALGAGQM